MPTSVVLPESQELALLALVESGAYKTQSEVLRAAIEEFLHRIPRATLVSAAVWAHKEGKVSLSKAARMANIEHEEMHRILVREGHFGSKPTQEEIKQEADFLSEQLGRKRSKVKRAR